MVADSLQNSEKMLPRQKRRRSTTKIDGTNRCDFFAKRSTLSVDLLYKSLDVTLPPMQGGQRVKIAIDALFPTKGDMDVEGEFPHSLTE